MNKIYLTSLLIIFIVFNGVSQCTPPAAPAVTSAVSYCQNATAIALTATGSNLLWGNPTQGSVGGTSALTSTTYVDGSYNNKKTNFTTTVANVKIASVDYYIPPYQTATGIILSVYNSSGTVIATSSTSTSMSAPGSAVKVTNTFNYTIATVGNYSIGVSSGQGNIGADNPSFPLTEATGTINITGVTTAGSRCFTNMVFAINPGATAPIPSTAIVGTSSYYVTQTVAGCTSAAAVINVTVNSSPNISQVPVSNIIANYRFEGNTNDASSNNNQGTLQNAPALVADRFGNANSAYSFDGITQYVSTARKYVNPTNFTISTWFKTTTVAGGKLIGFGALQTDQSWQYDRHIYMNNAGQLYFGVYPGVTKTVNSTLSYNDNRWHLATATLSSVNGMALYVDGALIASDPSTSTAESTTGYWRIAYDNVNGWTSQPSSHFFNGTLDDILIYHTALSASEISALYTSPDGAGNNGPVCSGSPFNLTATAITGATYSWTGPNSFSSAAQSPSVTYTAATAGVYTLQVTASGCTSTAYTTVAASNNAGQWTGNVSTDWANTGNWCNNVVPTAATNVVIGAGAVRMPSVISSVTCNNLTINNGATVTTTAAGTLNISGTLTNSGTMTNNGTTNFNGTAGQQTFSGVTSFYNLIQSNTTGLLLPAAITINNNLLLSGGKLNANNFALSVAGDFTNNASVIAFTAGTSTVTFSGTAAQSIGGSFATAFNNLTINNTGNTVSLAVNATIAGNLAVTSGIFDLLAYSANRTTTGGSLTVANNAVLKIGGTNTFPVNFSLNTLVVASTVEYSGTNQTVASKTYGNLKLTSSTGAVVKTLPSVQLTVLGDFICAMGAGSAVTVTAAAGINISGNVSLGASTTLNGNGFFHSIFGNWTNDGTFNGSTGTVNFAGAGAMVGGSGLQNFTNLTVSGAQVSFTGSAIGVNGNLVTTGSGSFSQVAGGTFTLTGSGKTISGSGISLENLTISGIINTSVSIAIAGNLVVSGSFIATGGTVSMSGISKTLSGSGIKNLYLLAVTGSITTDANFSIASGVTVAGSLSASAGTATFTGTSTLSGTANLFNVIINGTSLQLAGGAVLGIANLMTISAGTLNVTTSTPNTVQFNGTGAQNINAIPYNNLVLSNGNTKTAVSALTINNNLTIGAGTNFVPGAFTHSIYLNWINNGSFTAGSSTIQFLGSQNSTISGATTFNILTVNNTGNSIGVTLQNNISVSTVNMIAGTLFTGANTISITNTRTGNGIIMGNIQRTHAFIAGVAYAFEGPNNTISFSVVSGVTSVTVSVTKGLVNDFSYGSAINRLYDISVPAGTYTATLRLHYEDDELNGNSESLMGMWNYVTASFGWTPVGKSGNNSTTNYVEQTGLTNITNRWTCSFNPTVVQWNGSVSTNWNTAANWTVLVGAASAPPAASDVVVIGTAAFTNQPSINTAVSIKNMVFGSLQPVNLTIASGGSLNSGDIVGLWNSNAIHTINTNGQTINIDGDLSLGDGTAGHAINLNIGSGTVNVLGSINQSGGAAVVFTGSGNLNIANDYNITSGTFTRGTGTVTYNGINNQEVAAVNYNNLTINKTAATASINNALGIAGNLTITAGELDNFATTTILGNVNISPGTTLYNQNILHIGGNWNNSGTYNSNGSVTNVIFDGTGTQTISATTFNNLEINKPVGSVATLTGDVILKGNLVGTSGTLDIKSFFFNREIVGGSATIADAGTLIIAADNAPNKFANYYLGSNSTVIFNGTGTQHLALPGLAYGNIIFRNSGTKILYTAITVNNNLTIENSAVFDAGSNTIMLYGNWTNSGTFTPSASTLLLNGAAKTVSGNTTFNKVTVNGSYTNVADITYNDLLHITSTGAISSGTGIFTTLNGDLVNNGILNTSGTTTFTGNVLQTLSLINAVATYALIVNFNGTVSPELNSTSAPQFGYLNINNTGGVNPSVGWTIGYGLTVGAGASFNLGASAHTLYGSMLNNGTITSSGTLNMLPSLATTINMGSTFSSTGRVVFGGTGAITLAGTPISFNNVTVSNTNGSGLTPASNWILTGNLAVNNGSILNAGNRTHAVAGDFVNNGTLNSSTSLFKMNGTAAQHIYSLSAFNNLHINNTSGDVSLLTDITVNGTLNFISGKIITGSNSVIQSPTGSIINASQQKGWVDGYLQKVIQTGAVTKLFEVGDDNIYSPVSLGFANVSNYGIIKVRTVPGDHPAISSSAVNSNKDVNRYWSITNAGTEFSTCDVLLKYPSSDIDAGSSLPNFGVSVYSGSSWSLPVTATVTDTTILATGLTVFGDFIAGEICNKGTFISYTSSPYCAAAATASVSLTGMGGGTYSSGPGLSINPATGSINLGSSTPGTYTVVYSIASTSECQAYLTSANITITAAPSATIAYTASPYCSGGGIAYPSGSGTGGGVFSSSTGLSIDPVTGGVDPAASNTGTYTVTYTVSAAGGCSLYQATTNITIVAAGTWTGNVNTDWNNPGNWLCGVIPSSTTNVTIPTGAADYPVLTTAGALNNLVMQPGASATVSGGAMQVGGTITNAGMFDVSAGTIEMNGVSAQTIPANVFVNNKIKNLVISNNVSLASEDTLMGTLTVAAGKTFTTNDNLVLHSDANGTARIATLPVDGAGNATAFITGIVNIERYIPLRKAWRLLSAPVKTTGAPTINQAWQEGVVNPAAMINNPNPGYGILIQGGTLANGFDQGLTSSPLLKVFNNATNTFAGLPPSPGTYTPITSYPGYFVYIRGDRSINLMQGANAATTATTLRIKGQINTGNQTTNVNATGYTVLGNPFPSAIDFETLSKNNVKDAFYVWDPKLAGNFGLGGYVTFSWNSGSGMYDATTSASAVSKYIPSGEAVIIESADGINPGSITIKESDKTANGSDAVFGRTNGLNQQVRVDLYSLNADATNSILDGVLTSYDDDLSNDIDQSDAKKLNGGSENIGIKRNNSMLAIERRKTIIANDTTFLNIYQVKIANYQLRINMHNLQQTGTTAIITDSYSNTINNMLLDMNGTTIINFNINADPASYALNRFSIVFKTNVVLPVTFKSVKAYAVQKDIAVEWNTTNELNVKQYKVERSADGRSFTSIKTVAATALNGGDASYQFLDYAPLPGINYYRILSVDNDGKAGYSDIVKVALPMEHVVPAIAVYPNPVTGKTISLRFTGMDAGDYVMQVFNSSGQLVLSKTVNYNGSATESFGMQDNFVPGKYVLQLTGKNINLVVPLIKQ